MSHDSHGATAHGNGHGHVGHIVPVHLLLGILVALLALTGLTVLLGGVKLGALNVWVALIIATVKASLVVLYFMHLRWDRPFNGLIFISSLVFVALFVSLALTDTATCKSNVWQIEAPAITAKEAGGK